MPNLYTGQMGQIQGDTGDTRVFPITAGVRQGCVLSPRLFTAILNGPCKNGGKGWKILHVVLIWKTVMQNYWISDLQMTYYCLPVPNFETIFMLETLMEELAYVGLCLNAGKTVALTNEAQPPQCLILTNQEDNCRKRQRCWTQMVGLYFLSGGQWKANFGHHLSFTGRLKGILR